MENADLQSRKMMGSNPSTRANMVASTRGLSHRPLFGLVINMSALLIPDTTRRSRGFESRCNYQMALIASDRDIMDMLYRFHTICRYNLLQWLYRLSERIYPCHG